MSLSVVHLPLRLHPDCCCDAVEAIDVVAKRVGGALTIRFLVKGDMDKVRLPEPGQPGPADGLWKHSCFEAFVRPGEGPGYIECNFAPSMQWAFYGFEDYRQGMHPLDLGPPHLTDERGDRDYMLEASVGMPQSVGEDWTIGLSAVIEESDGRISYWALNHPAGKPDFHHRDCFAARLDAPRAS